MYRVIFSEDLPKSSFPLQFSVGLYTYQEPTGGYFFKLKIKIIKNFICFDVTKGDLRNRIIYFKGKRCVYHAVKYKGIIRVLIEKSNSKVDTGHLPFESTFLVLYPTFCFKDLTIIGILWNCVKASKSTKLSPDVRHTPVTMNSN